ncbi:hypothetical protein QOZ80_6AG0551160 [Eleusine coracana subsp. coracana]|nr:hypothetical protein QOZ80_6AG0551160 [Eleusine coracana subsp. coracana]
MSPEKKRMVGLWEREVGRLAPKHFANAVMASQDFVHSLNIQKRLRKHRGCVNTLSFNADGSLLLSGSDDRSLALWNWEEAVPTFTFHTGHSNNVLHAQFMHLSNDRSIVSCAADGEVRHSKIQQGGCVITDELVELEFAVHKLAVEPGSPHTFYCCCEDSSVWLFDLRGKDAVELFKCGAADHFSGENVELFAIAIDPRKPCFFAVAGSDEYVRIYDTRKICLDGSSRFGRPTEHFCPPHLIGENKDGITGLAFSQTSELLASYSYDNIYLFSAEHGLHFNNVEVGEQLLMDETEGICNINTAPLPFCRDKLPIPTAFKGHRNIHTIKGVNFLGPNCDYVTSGSDCGHIFIWRKKDGQLIRVMKGDKRIVNCVEQHPSGIVVASSGIENDIKIWEPGECENPSITHIEEVEAEMWHSSSSDSDAFLYYNDYDYMMDSDDDLYIETDGSVEDIDTSEDSSEEDEDSDNSAKEDGDGDNSGKDMSDG